MAYGKPAGRAAPLPPDEAERLRALGQYRILDTLPDPEFDELARLASWICGTPIALVSLVDSERQWFKARVGMPAPQTPRDVAFCAHTILDERLFVVPDALADERFAGNPLVTDDHIRFYAGAPLRTGDGHALGALCVMDRVPRELDERQREALLTISHQVMARLELQRALRETVQAMQDRSSAQTELLQQTVTLRAVLQGMGDGVVVANSDGSLRMINRAAEMMLGQGMSDAQQPDWASRYRLFMPDGQTPYPPESLPLVLAIRGEQVDNVELCLRVPGQSRRWVSSAARPLREEGGAVTGGIVVFRDVTERRQAEGRLRAQHAITRLLADAMTLADAAPQILRAMGQYLGWDAGELWELDPWTDILQISAAWHPEDPALRAVVEAGRAQRLRAGQGLPGRAWQQRDPVFAQVGADDELLRSRLASEAGLRAALAFPVVSAERPQAVVVLWSREPQDPDADLLSTVHGLGAQIGQFIARRQAEAALRASEERMRMLFQRTPYPAWIYDEGTQRILAVNDAALVAYGHSHDAFLSLTHRDLRAPEDPDAPERQPGASGGAATSVVRHRRRDGTVVDVEESSQGMVIDGRPARCVFVKDLTEQQRGQLALAERLAASTLGAAVSTALTWGGTLHRKLQDCAQALVHNLDLEMAGIWTRSEAGQSLDLLGGAVREGTLPASQSRLPLGAHWLGRVAQGRLPQWLDLAEDTVPAELSWTRVAGMHYLAGYPLVVESRSVGVIALGSARPLSQSTIDSIALLADEIALHMEREEVRAALTASEARHRAVLENMLGGLLVIDERGFIESGNAEAERIFGFGREGLVGQHLSVVMPLAIGSDHQGALNDGFRRAVSRITEWEGRRHSGESFPFELALYEMQTPAGRRFGAHIRDLSERREVERLKKEFVAVVSHELRTPLTSIRGSLSLLAGGALGELPDEAREVVAIAERNTVRLIHLINDILDLERLEAGRMPMYVSLHPLEAIARRALEAVRAMADQQEIAIDVEPTTLEVLGDADRVVQVLVNLMSNAVKFSPRGGVVTVAAHEEEGWVEVRVQDRGRGIPHSHRDAIFQRFQQVESSDGRQKGGTGLGLAICKTIVEQLGGSMGVVSEMGEGSTFWFRLRSGPPDRAGDSLLAAVAEAIPDDARDVLLLDEDEAFLGVMGRQLLSAGIPVRTARTVRQGVAQARERAPALVVLDVRFPDGEGADVVRAFSEVEALRALPLLVYTSRDLGEGERSRLRLGASRFLTKSQATEQDVLDAVRELRDAGEPS